MDEGHDLDELTESYHRSMTIVEETTLKLRNTICRWLLMNNIDLEPQKKNTIDHLEHLLSYLKAITNCDEDQAGDVEQEIEIEHEHHRDDSEVCRL